MKRFMIRFLLYLLPLPLYLGSILIFDPFNYYEISQFISNKTKHSISKKLHPQLWKMLEFKRKRTDIIILGDSRSEIIDIEHVRKLYGKDVYNFSYGGGTLLDMIETFWYAEDLTTLKEVYIGINFNLYNDFEKNNHVIQAQSISQNFLSYSFSKIVFTASFKNLKRQFLDKNLQIGVPEMNFDQFWKYHLEVNGKRFYQKYRYPADIFKRLKEICDYCRDNNIKLIFFIPPNHTDWQQRVSDFALINEYNLFLDDLAELGKVYNFDVANEFTSNRKNFRDPVHAVNDSLVIHTIWDKSSSN